MFQAINYVSPKDDTAAAAGSDKPAPAAPDALTTFAFKSKQPGVVAAFDASVKKHKAASSHQP